MPVPPDRAWQLPWLRLHLFMRDVIATRCGKDWLIVKRELARVVEMRRAMIQAGWFNERGQEAHVVTILFHVTTKAGREEECKRVMKETMASSRPKTKAVSTMPSTDEAITRERLSFLSNGATPSP